MKYPRYPVIWNFRLVCNDLLFFLIVYIYITCGYISRCYMVSLFTLIPIVYLCATYFLFFKCQKYLQILGSSPASSALQPCNLLSQISPQCILVSYLFWRITQLANNIVISQHFTVCLKIFILLQVGYYIVKLYY